MRVIEVKADRETGGRRMAAGNGPRIAVAIMAKAPRAGEVKTRLCPPFSPSEAAELYQCFLRDKIAQVLGLAGASPVIAFTPADGRSLFEGLAPGFRLIPQEGAISAAGS